jgi:predicted choloylglycine hydrolase
MGTAKRVSVDVLELEGDHFEIGFQHGKALGAEIRAYLARDFAEINLLRTNQLREDLIEEYVEPYKRIISQCLPGSMDELRGLAEGAEISIDQAVLLQVRRELIGTEGFSLLGDCSSFAKRESGHSVLGQTIDLPGDMTSLGQVFKIQSGTEGAPRIMMYSFAGLLGYMGMNSFGLAICINLVVSEGWRIGVPPYLLARAFLNCKDIESCIDLVRNMPIASSRSFILSDNERQVVLELNTTGYRIVEGDFLTHANHYIHGDLKEGDRLNVFSKNSSAKRMRLLQDLLLEDATLDGIKRTFSDHSLYPVGICAHNESNYKWSETVASVIMYPGRGEFHALKGKPCQGEYSIFKL